MRVGRVRQSPPGSDFAAGDLVAGAWCAARTPSRAGPALAESSTCRRNGRYTERGIWEVDGFGAQLLLLPRGKTASVSTIRPPPSGISVTVCPSWTSSPATAACTITLMLSSLAAWPAWSRLSAVNPSEAVQLTRAPADTSVTRSPGTRLSTSPSTWKLAWTRQELTWVTSSAGVHDTQIACPREARSCHRAARRLFGRRAGRGGPGRRRPAGRWVR